MNKRIFLIGFFSIIPGLLFAYNDAFLNQLEKKTYIGVKAGYSISTPMNFQPDYDSIKQSTWIAFEHAQFNSNMNTSPLYGAFIGYTLNPNVSVDLAYDYRNNYQWDKISSIYFPDSPTDPLLAIGERWQAKHISIQSLIFSVNLKPCVNWGGVIPYASVGVGAAWNKIGSFENNEIPSSSTPTRFDIQVPGATTTNFAWKVGAGINYVIPCYQQWLLSLGYQFVDVGTLQTGTTFVDPIRRKSGTTNPFKADHVQLNEVFLGATYYFA